jgi:hypothetical protein
MGYKLNQDMMEVFEWNAFMFGVGSVFVAQNIQNAAGDFASNSAANYLMWAILLISLVNIFLPMEKVNERIFPLKDVAPEQDYSEIYNHFEVTDYDRRNYVTREKSIKLSEARKKKEDQTQVQLGYFNDDLEGDPIYLQSLEKYWNEARVRFDLFSSDYRNQRPAILLRKDILAKLHLGLFNIFAKSGFFGGGNVRKNAGEILSGEIGTLDGQEVPGSPIAEQDSPENKPAGKV